MQLICNKCNGQDMCCALKQPSIAACPVGGSIFLAGTADTQTCSAVQPENTCVVEFLFCKTHALNLKHLTVRPMIKWMITSEVWDSISLPDDLIFLKVTLNMFHRRWHLNSTKSFGTQIALAFICNICPTPFKKMNCHMPISLALCLGVRGSLNS